MADLQCHGLDLFGALTCERSLVRIVDEARTLKGAAGTAGLCRLSVLAATLEHTAASLTPTAYADLVARIDASFQTGRAAIDGALSRAFSGEVCGGLPRKIRSTQGPPWPWRGRRNLGRINQRRNPPPNQWGITFPK
jgi:hypothetical protein